MATFLLTWNGDSSSFGDRTYEELVDATRLGAEVHGSWSFGNRRSGTSAGDVVYLLMQGRARGIVGMGTLESDSLTTGPHWRDPSRVATYAPVLWRTILPVEYRLTTDVLKRALPNFNWNYVLASGQRVPDGLAESLDRLWSERVEESLGDSDAPRNSSDDVYAWLNQNKMDVSHVLDDALITVRSVFGPDVQLRLVRTFVASQVAPRVARIEILVPAESESGWDRLIRVNQLLIAHEEQLKQQTNASEPLLSVQLVLAGSDPTDWSRRTDEPAGLADG